MNFEVRYIFLFVRQIKFQMFNTCNIIILINTHAITRWQIDIEHIRISRICKTNNVHFVSYVKTERMVWLHCYTRLEIKTIFRQ